MATTLSAARRIPLLERAGGFFFARRNIVFPVVLAALLGGLPPELAFDSPEADRRVTAGGIIVALLGQAQRVAVIGLAYIRRGGRHGRVYAARLVTQGIFAHCRNPLYVGNLLVLLGLFLVHGNAWACALGMAFFAFAYRAIVAAEEAYLHERFGAEYERYCAQVNRWLPDFRGLRRSLEGMRFDWARVVAKEYGSTAAWTAALLVLMAVKTVRIEGAANHPVRLAVLAALVVMVGVGFLAARVWKKSRAALAETPRVLSAATRAALSPGRSTRGGSPSPCSRSSSAPDARSRRA